MIFSLIVKVAVISGGDWPQFEKQLLSNLPHDERLGKSVSPSNLRNKVLTDTTQRHGKRFIRKI
jgi:hypothetical protein